MLYLEGKWKRGGQPVKGVTSALFNSPRLLCRGESRPYGRIIFLIERVIPGRVFVFFSKIALQTAYRRHSSDWAMRLVSPGIGNHLPQRKEVKVCFFL